MKSHFLDYIAFLRIKDWFYVIGIAYLGLFYRTENMKTISYFDIYFILIIASLYLAHGYSINSYFDLRIEGLKSTKEILGNISRKKALLLSSSLFFINLCISFFYSNLIFFLVLLGGIISFLYSSAYTNLKYRPLSNIVLNSTGFTFLFALGYVVNKPVSATMLYTSGYIWLGIVPLQIIHLVAHNPVERNWPFSLKSSFKLLYLSQLIWVIWSFITFCFLDAMPAVFMLTLMFCVAQIILIIQEKKAGINGILSIRRNFRIISIIFGIILTIFFSIGFRH